MILRRLPAVAPRVALPSLARAFVASLGSGEFEIARARARIAAHFGAESVVATDSGTSALVLALRLAASNRRTVGFPGYGCVDLAAAARYAGVGVRLYDLDPATLSPDIDSVERLLQRGVDAIVVAHLFGYPADVDSVREVARRRGVTVIEDAAQAAGGRLGGRPLGSLGDLTVLSFGRGKGLSAGGGGALLASNGDWRAAVESLRLGTPPRGLPQLAKSAAQWALGRPSLYAIPSAVPWLHLGEMVYHPAHEPASISTAAASTLDAVIAREAVDVRSRRAVADALAVEARAAEGLCPIVSVPGGEAGFLRYAVLDRDRAHVANASLGIVRPYPVSAAEQVELAPALIAGEAPTPGARELASSLFALPTHQYVTRADVAALGKWMRTGEVHRSPDDETSGSRYERTDRARHSL